MREKLVSCLLAMMLISTNGFSEEVRFDAEVWPIVSRHCIRCHGADKQEGDLRLDSPDGIRTGGEFGAVVETGKPDASTLIELISLSADDPDVMPSKGKTLSKDEIATLVRWVQEGVTFGGWSPNLAEQANADAKAYWAEKRKQGTVLPAIFKSDIKKIQFNRDIRPILSDNCFKCHGQDSAVRSADLRLDIEEEALAKRDGYRVIHPGKARASELVNRIFNNDDEIQMPPGDSKTVFPAMFGLLAIFMFIFTRSIGGTIATWCVIALSATGAMGASGYYGYGVNPANMAAPVVILTLAIADSIHILLSMFKEMSNGSEKLTALRESMRINAQPVFLTSLTTAIGFLVMNFSDSPPFQELGNITATGVGLAWLLSISFLPAMLSVLPIKAHKGSSFGEPLMLWFAEVNIKHRKLLVIVMGGSIIFFMASISQMKIDDTPHQYFAESIPFRTSTDFYDEKLGFYGFYMSIIAEEPGGINDPEYLKSLDNFVQWLRVQPGVEYVGAYSDIIAKLNMNMHADDPAYRVVPDNRDLAAQYLLLYEMSLPLGRDLNDQINVDKSATRLFTNFRATSLADVQAVGIAAEEWFNTNAVNGRADQATGPPVMFSYITETNIKSMTKGTLFGFVLIAIILIISLRNVVLGILSLIPNIVPAATAFGIWALVEGEAGFAISVVAGLSIGIIVDDTVHFLSKYSRARQELGLNSEEAVRYAFRTVGQALLSTSFIVAGGFAVLMLSTFRVTSFMGALTALTIVCALVADFLLLPSILLILDRRSISVDTEEAAPEAA